LNEQDMGSLINERLQLDKETDLSLLKKFVHNYKNPDSVVVIAMCGKYTELGFL
jgi:CTP synthase (UTP-ammonia lyase)